MSITCKNRCPREGLLTASLLLAGMLIGGPAISAPVLVDYEVQVDDSIVGSFLDGTDFAGFDESTGLGTVSLTVSGAGEHSAVAFFDHEFGDIWFDESGSVTGTLASGQRWEIDDPVTGDILPLSYAGLDNTLGALALGSNDVSMATGWSFTLAANELATIAFNLSDTVPNAAFYLTHSEEEVLGIAPEAVYFWSTLTIRSLDTNPDDGNDQDPNPVPLPSTLLLMMSALATVVPFARRKSIA